MLNFWYLKFNSSEILNSKISNKIKQCHQNIFINLTFVWLNSRRHDARFLLQSAFHYDFHNVGLANVSSCFSLTYKIRLENSKIMNTFRWQNVYFNILIRWDVSEWWWRSNSQNSLSSNFWDADNAQQLWSIKWEMIFFYQTWLNSKKKDWVFIKKCWCRNIEFPALDL